MEDKSPILDYLPAICVFEFLLAFAFTGLALSCGLHGFRFFVNVGLGEIVLHVLFFGAFKIAEAVLAPTSPR